jgi:hypothetical protein
LSDFLTFLPKKKQIQKRTFGFIYLAKWHIVSMDFLEIVSCVFLLLFTLISEILVPFLKKSE